MALDAQAAVAAGRAEAVTHRAFLFAPACWLFSASVQLYVGHWWLAAMDVGIFGMYARTWWRKYRPVLDARRVEAARKREAAWIESHREEYR